MWLFKPSRFDVWRRRSTTPTDARSSCRAFFYVVTATPSFKSPHRHGRYADQERRTPLHRSIRRYETIRGRIFAAKILHRKAWRFVLSRRNAENRSCFRVGMDAPFVLSRRNRRGGFVLSNRNGCRLFVLSSRNAPARTNQETVGTRRRNGFGGRSAVRP